MLVVRYYVFKQLLSNPRGYLPAVQAEQLENLPNSDVFSNLMEFLILSLCQDELAYSNSLGGKFSIMLGKSLPLSGPSSEALLALKNFLTANNDFYLALQHIFHSLEEKDIGLQLDEIGPQVLSLRDYIRPLVKFIFAAQSLEPSAFAATLQQERSKGFFAYIEQRNRINGLAKNYLRLRDMHEMIALLHGKYSAVEFREILDKLQKIPLPPSFMATCDHKILLERYKELEGQAEYFQSPAMTKLFDEINRYSTASSLHKLIRVALNHNQPISYLSNLISIGLLFANNPKCLERLIKKMSSRNFPIERQTALELLTLENSRRTEEKIPVDDFEYLVYGPHRQIRLSFPANVSRHSPVAEMAEYILKKYYLKNYPNIDVGPNQLYRPNNGFDHISRMVLLLQFLVSFLNHGALRVPSLKVFNKDELSLLTLAILCHAAASPSEDATQAAIFRAEALSLGYPLDQVEPIACALKNKNNHAILGNDYQWLIHDTIRIEDLRFVDTLGKDELSDTFNAITPGATIRFKRIIDNYKKVIGRFMAANRLQMQQSQRPFLATKALMYQIALELAANPSSTNVLTFDTTYLLLGEIDPLLLFDPGPELLKYALNKLFDELQGAGNEPRPDHQKLYFNLYTLISSNISIPLSDLANYHCKNSYFPETIHALATRYLEDQNAKLTASPEFKEMWIYASHKMKDYLPGLVTLLLLNKKIPFTYLSNAISIALHLFEKPFFREYCDAAIKEDLPTLMKTGVKLLERASKEIFPGQGLDEELERLALGAHLQILYKPRVIFEGKLINHQSRVEEIAPYIIYKYYLKPQSVLPVATKELVRPIQGFDHVSRSLLLFQLIVSLLKKYDPTTLCSSDGTALSASQLRLVALAVLCHNANTNGHYKNQTAQAEIFRSEALLLGFRDEEIEPIAWAFENKDNKNSPRNICQWLIHDSNYLDSMHVILDNLNSFRKEELDSYKALKAPEAITKFEKIIENYKKIITRFMASDRVPLQNSKNSFLVTKAFLYQIALDLMVNPANTGELNYNPSYLMLDDIDPLLVFDPGSELLKLAFNKIFLNMPDKSNVAHQEIIFNLFNFISCQISEPLANVGKYLTSMSYLGSVSTLANRYFNDHTANVTASPEFKRLWLHAESKFEKKLLLYFSELLCNKKIPFSYLHNAISIMLHLADTPYLAEYITAAKMDLAAFTNTGARLLELAHEHFFPNQSPNPELKQLALGAHQQIRYPQRVIFENKLINHQTPVEKIAPYIIEKYYLKLYTAQPIFLNGLLRPLHGFDHVSRSLLLFQFLERLLQKCDPTALCNPNGTPLSASQLRLLALAVLCRGAANTNEHFNNEVAQAGIFRFEAMLLGFSDEEIEPIAWALENNKSSPRNISQCLIHDSNYLDSMRVVLENLNSFCKEELDSYKALKTPEAITKFERIIENYKKIITRFMVSNRIPLQANKNSFLATKAFLFQIALDLAINPTNTGELNFDPRYLELDDIDPLLLFDPGPELLQCTFSKIYPALLKTMAGPNFDFYQAIYFDLFTRLSGQISEPLSKLAKYHCGNLFTLGQISRLATRYLNDNQINFTNTPEFKKLWLHAESKFQKFLPFISNLLSNNSIPCSYLHNAISVALHLADTPYLAEYIDAVDENFDAFIQTGARLLDLAHEHFFPDQSPDLGLKQLALGAHQQIRYPQRVIFEGKLLNHQTPVEKIAVYIIDKYYSKPYSALPVVSSEVVRPAHSFEHVYKTIASYLIDQYSKPNLALPVVPNELVRPFHGFDHVSRALLLFQLIESLLQKYKPDALRNPNGTPLSDRQLRLLALAVLCHDAANTNEHFKDEVAQANIFRAEALLLGFSNEEIEPIAWALANKDTKNAFRNILQWLIHDPDCMEFMRVILNSLNLFRKKELDSYKALNTSQARTKFEQIIENYKKIITRFMASNRVPLQNSKNSFLATKALVSQIALDLAINPANTGGLNYNPGYLIFDDVEPLVLFDTGPELLKYAFSKIFHQMAATPNHLNFENFREINFDLFTRISCKISEPLGQLAKYHCKKLYTTGTILALATRYLNDPLVNITATNDFKRLWLHAAGKVKKFFRFMSDLLCYNNIPFSYLRNAISIALHLADTPYLAEYISAADEDLASFTNTGARLLELAHKHLFPNQPLDPELKLLALGFHDQIRYPQRVLFRGKLLNHHTKVEDIAPYILDKYYLKPYSSACDSDSNGLLRNIQGFDHISRSLILLQLIVRLLEEYYPPALRNPNGTVLSDSQLRLVALAVLCSRAANTNDHFNNNAAQAEVFRLEALLLGFPGEEIEPIAWALENKNTQSTTRTIYQSLIHDTSCLEYMRTIIKNLNSFQRPELDIHKMLTQPEASSKLDRVIDNYKKIITRFMATNRILLQKNKNSFLATKDCLYEIALNLAVSPSSTRVLEFCYPMLGEIDPLMLFDPSIELLKYAENKAYQLLQTTQADDRNIPEYEESYYRLYTLISSQISEQSCYLAEYHHNESSYDLKTLHQIAIRYLNDKTASITASPTFKKLCSYAFDNLDQFDRFITLLFSNDKIPFSYVTNAICIALHLLETPSSLKQYIEAASTQDLGTFTALGAQLLEKDLQPLALGPHQQIRYPGVIFEGKRINNHSTIDDIAPYILKKYYLKHYAAQAEPRPPLFRAKRGFDHVTRCLVLFQVWIKLLEEESPETLINPEGKPLGEKEKTLLQVALLCHEAANLKDEHHDNKAHADIFRSEAELLGFLPSEFEPIATALINKDVKGPHRTLYEWLVHASDCVEYLRFIPDRLNSFDKQELDLYKHFVKTKNNKAVTRLTDIIEKYKKIIVSFMASDRVPLQEHSNSYLATKAFLYQIAIHHTRPSAGNIVIFEPNSVTLINDNPLCLFDSAPEFLRSMSGKIRLYPDKGEVAKELFKTEGLYLRAFDIASTKTHIEESTIRENREIIAKSKIANNPQLFWEGYQQNKLQGIKFRPVTFIKQGLAILPYLENKSVSFLIRANNNTIKFYKRNIFSNAIANGNFNFQRTTDGIKGLDSNKDFENKVIELNARRLGKQPDPYNRYYGSSTLERNEIFFINYELKDVVGINIGRVDGNPNHKANLIEALYWYVRLGLANQEPPQLYHYCPFVGELVSLSLNDLLNTYFNNVDIPNVIAHNMASFSDIQLKNPNYQVITNTEIIKAEIKRDKLEWGTEIYKVKLESGKKFAAMMHSRGFPIIKIDGDAKGTYDGRALLPLTVRVYQERTAQACRELLLNAKSYLEKQYLIESIDIKIVHQQKNYPNVPREKSYLYCEVNFLKNPHVEQADVSSLFLQKLLGIKIDQKTVEVNLPQLKIILRDRTPHKILEVFAKLQREIQENTTEKKTPSITTTPAP